MEDLGFWELFFTALGVVVTSVGLVLGGMAYIIRELKKEIREDMAAQQSDLKKYVDTRIDDLKGHMDARFEQVDARFEQMDARFEQMDTRMNGFESQMRTFTAAQRRTSYEVGRLEGYLEMHRRKGRLPPLPESEPEEDVAVMP